MSMTSHGQGLASGVASKRDGASGTYQCRAADAVFGSLLSTAVCASSVHDGRTDVVAAERITREGEEELSHKHKRRQGDVEDDARVEGLRLGLCTRRKRMLASEMRAVNGCGGAGKD